VIAAINQKWPSHGLPQSFLSTVCKSTLVSRLLYASPSWWGCISEVDRSRLQGVPNRAARWGLSPSPPFNLSELCDCADLTLFHSVLSIPYHTLHTLLPAPILHSYFLRARLHQYTVPLRDKFTPFIFLRRMLFL